jgi:hypothetical protein
VETAYFRMTDTDGVPRFTIKLEDAARIAHARAILHGQETRRIRVAGTVVKTTTPYNPYWTYHLEPASIDFFEQAIEVCDAASSTCRNTFAR